MAAALLFGAVASAELFLIVVMRNDSIAVASAVRIRRALALPQVGAAVAATYARAASLASELRAMTDEERVRRLRELGGLTAVAQTAYETAVGDAVYEHCFGAQCRVAELFMVAVDLNRFRRTVADGVRRPASEHCEVA